MSHSTLHADFPGPYAGREPDPGAVPVTAPPPMRPGKDFGRKAKRVRYVESLIRSAARLVARTFTLSYR